MRDIYTASPGLPQDLSCRKQFALKNESQKLPAIQEDSEACLPPIATFSHHRQNRIGPCSSYVGKSGKSVGRKRQKQPRSRHTENKFYCDWPQCPRFLLKKPFKQMTHLKHHLLLHKNHLNLSCSQCGKRFSSKENLKRHTNVHSGLKPYICSICRQAYSRTSERSRCMKKHHFEDKYFSEQDKQCLYKDVYSDWNSSGLSALQIEDKINQSRPRPYICQICNDHRAYTDPSSLRKHMRSHHTNCKNEKSMTDRDSTNETVISKSKLSKIVQYEEPISLVLANSTTDIDAVDSSHLSFDNSFTTESKSLLLTTDSVYPVVIAPYNALTTSMTSSEIPVTTNVMISFNNNNVITESNISTNIINTPRYHLLLRSDSIVSPTMMTVISMTSTTTTNTTTTLKNEYDGDVAVDLCNSALCLQVYSDKYENNLSQSNQPFKSDSQSHYMECVNLTPFGEFLVWTAEAVIWLRRNYRIIGRASLPLELFKACHPNQSKKPDRLPVRLSFEEVVLLLSKGFIHGILCSRPVISVAEPSKETIEAYHHALMKNAEEMVNIFKTQKRLRLVGYYGQLLNGLKLRQERQARSKLFNRSDSSSVNTINDDGCSKNCDTDNLNSSSQLSSRKRRRQRRLFQKQLKKQMLMTGCSSGDNDDDHCNIYDSDQDVSEPFDSPITLDDLISVHSTTHQGTSKLSVIPNKNIQEYLPYIPQHLPRPTPIEWRRPDEYLFVSLPESVFSEGPYSIVIWLIQLIQEKCKATNFSNQHTDNQNNISSSQDMYIQRLQSCLIYMDLWNKGYYISTSTMKMGGDFLVYQGDPLLYHGSHIITICKPTDSFSNSLLLAKLRIANGLKKILVLATVSNIEMFTRKFTIQIITHYEIKNDNDNDDSAVDPQAIVGEHSKLSVQSKEITSNEGTRNNCNNNINEIQPNVIYLSLQYMSSHSSNPTFSKSL